MCLVVYAYEGGGGLHVVLEREYKSFSSRKGGEGGIYKEYINVAMFRSS